MAGLNYTKDGYIDYTYMDVENPPQFHPFEFEKFDYEGFLVFLNRNPHVPFVAVFLYLILIFGIQKVMKNREAFELKMPLVLWNGALGIMSIVGFVRCAPEFFYQLSQVGFHSSVCVRQGGNVPFLFWSMIFVYSKYVELGDTLFIVLRKKPLVFLQWIHHSLTLIACWIAAPYVEAISRYYVVMNFGVHSLMYPYFSLMALGVKIPRGVANGITTLQLLQMLVGLFVNVYSVIIHSFGGHCTRHPTSIKMFGAIYGLFVILFGRLFYQLILSRRKNTKKE